MKSPAMPTPLGLVTIVQNYVRHRTDRRPRLDNDGATRFGKKPTASMMNRAKAIEV